MSKLPLIVLFLLTPIVLLAIMPGFASDFTLEIFGNANMDDTVDEMDITYVEEIISGNKEATELADANCDGKIDESDLDQIRRIIAGDEENLTIIDSYKRVVTIKKPVERIVSISIYNFEALRMLGELDRVVAIENNAKEKGLYFPQAAELPSIGGYPPNAEAILKFQPDLLLGAT
jgi:iron complex transport system substrate-binding protein